MRMTYIYLTLVLSCPQKPQDTGCNEIIDGSFEGKAAVFFHKPVSGSTYQIFLLPFCNADYNSKLKEPFSRDNLGIGISFNLTSDSPQFKSLYSNTEKLNLKGRDRLAENLRFIYYCLAKVEISYSRDNSKISEEAKKLMLDSNEVVLKFHFVSSVDFKIISP